MEVIGRLMADPAFVQKMLIEQLITIIGSLLCEAQRRGDPFSKELDLVAINTLSLAASQVALVWLLSPSRLFRFGQQLPWQQMLASFPSHIFEAQTRHVRFSGQQQISSLFTKASELAAVGTIAGAAMWSFCTAAVAVRRLQVRFLASVLFDVFSEFGGLMPGLLEWALPLKCACRGQSGTLSKCLKDCLAQQKMVCRIVSFTRNIFSWTSSMFHLCS